MGNKTVKHQEPAHVCQFTKKDHLLEWIIPKNTRCSRFRRKIRAAFLISEENGRKCFSQMSSTGYIYERARHLTHHYYMIHPYSKFREKWETLMICHILSVLPFSTLVEITVKNDICDHGAHAALFEFLYFLSDLIEVTDLILRFFTGYLNRKTHTITLNRKKVFRHNMKSRYLIIDLIGVLPFRFVFYHLFEKPNCPDFPLNYLIFFKILRMRIFQCYIAHKAKIHQWTDRFYQGVLIFVYVSAGCGWLTALYYKMMILDPTEYWIESFEDVSELLPVTLNVYIMTFYFTISILMLQNGLLGSADITEILDIVFCSVILIIAYFVSAIVLGMFLYSYGLRKTSKIKYYEMIQAVQKYMIHKDLPKELQKTILDYYEFKYRRNFFRERDILATINESLRNEISFYCGSYMFLDKESVFSKLPNEIIASLCVAMKSKIYMTNDIIAVAGEETKRLFIVGCGTVAVYSSSGKEIDHLHEGSQFGLLMLVRPDSQYLFTYVALEPCEIFILTYDDLVEAIGENSEYMDAVVKAVLKRRDDILKYLKKERNSLDFESMDLETKRRS